MEPDEDICRCLSVSDGTNNHNEILTNHLFTKVFDFLYGQSNKKIIISCGIKEKIALISSFPPRLMIRQLIRQEMCQPVRLIPEF